MIYKGTFLHFLIPISFTGLDVAFEVTSFRMYTCNLSI